MIVIRQEQSGDQPGIRQVNEQAFGQPQEADLVDKLRQNCPQVHSLVADSDGEIVGHILFSPVQIDNVNVKIEGMGLGPMAVLPNLQRQGIGIVLVNTGLENLRKEGCPFVVVLGHPDYYPRFGFQPASDYGLRCIWDVPEGVFQVFVMNESILSGVTGLVHYRHEFSELG